jgi:hypothetical protein
MNALTTEIRIDDLPATEGELHVEFDRVEVSSRSMRPDPGWEFVDAAGHYHAWAGKEKDYTLPTLVQKVERVPFEYPDEDDESEDYEIRHYHCMICDEQIEPGLVAPPLYREFAQGRMSWRVVVPVHVPIRQRASVRVSVGEKLYFGVGVASEGTYVSDGRARTTIIGASELGERKAPAAVGR